MFNVEYRTISTFGQTYPSNIVAVGSHHAASSGEAAAYVVGKFGRVEVVAVEYVGSL